MTDVIIIGAGPTGLTLSLDLLRRGVPHRLIDKQPGPTVESRALVVWPRTLEVLDDLGVAAEAVSRGAPIKGFNLMSKSRSARIDLAQMPDLGTRYPFVLGLPQRDTEAVLNEELARRGHAPERLVTFTAYRETKDGVSVTLTHADGQREEVEARYLIGCDGARSQVRSAAGIPFPGLTYEDECFIADARVTWDLPDGELRICPTESGILAFFPLPGEHHYRVLSIHPAPLGARGADLPAPTPEQFQDRVSAMAPLPVALHDISWLVRYRLHRRGVATYRKGRVILAGDAAHIHSPIGGQGMNTGIQDAYNLGWKLGLILAGRAEESLLQTYDDERHRVGELLLGGTDRAFSLIAARGKIASFVREHLTPQLGRLVMSSHRGQQLFLGLLSQLRINYRKSPLSRGSRDPGGQRAPHEGLSAGDRAPNAAVTRAGAPEIKDLADAWRGPEHALLLFVGSGDGQAIRAVASELTAAYPDLLRVLIIASARGGAGDDVLIDATGEAARRYGISSPRAYLLRPDKYIGYCSESVDQASLLAELRSRLGAPR
jgi:2-polyprenyl-6-methoxyphenol hydroxylase-like FAD-dependent oxidoreductase